MYFLLSAVILEIMVCVLKNLNHTSHRVLREVQNQDVDVKVNKGKTETVQVAVGGEVFSEYPGTKVYLRFDVILSVQGTSQMFAQKIPVAPNRPELKIVGPGLCCSLLMRTCV